MTTCILGAGIQALGTTGTQSPRPRNAPEWSNSREERSGPSRDRINAEGILSHKLVESLLRLLLTVWSPKGIRAQDPATLC